MKKKTKMLYLSPDWEMIEAEARQTLASSPALDPLIEPFEPEEW